MVAPDRGRRFDRGAFAIGVPVGPLLVLLGYVGALATDVVVGDPLLLAIAAWPTLGALAVALAWPGRRRAWLAGALGCATGTVVTVVVVVGLISGLAHVLSDPGGRPGPD